MAVRSPRTDSSAAGPHKWPAREDALRLFSEGKATQPVRTWVKSDHGGFLALRRAIRALAENHHLLSEQR